MQCVGCVLCGQCSTGWGNPPNQACQALVLAAANFVMNHVGVKVRSSVEYLWRAMYELSRIVKLQLLLLEWIGTMGMYGIRIT